MTTAEQLKNIKQSFRLIMDGSIAQSMRDKGVNYHLNWGAGILFLKNKADEIGQDYDLAIALWKENIRECKILATMIMPPEKMLPEVLDLWVEQIPTVEIAEQLAFNLVQKLPFSGGKAFVYLSQSATFPQIVGFHTLSRLFMQHVELNERAINEFIDQAVVALLSDNVSLSKSAKQALIRFSEISLMHKRLVSSATSRAGMTIL